MLRNYQQNAHDAVIAFSRKSTESCIIDAATGAGKSHIIAALSRTYHDLSGGNRVLCTAPSAELVEQNHAKYLATGNPASMFSASAGQISLRDPVTFGTPKTIINRIDRFEHNFSALIIDEAHKITPVIRRIARHLKQTNQNLRIVGTTATPYRMGTGHIYEIDLDNKRSEGLEPYFKKLVYRITAPELIDMGFLTPPKVITPGMHYDTAHLKLNSLFKYKGVDAAFEGQGRKTSKIIADIIEKSQDKLGVLIYAATVRHAIECMESLPHGISALITGKTPKGERNDIIKRFKRQEIKYVVNVDVLTTGFDAEHVDVIAMLRLTESVSLLQQIIGRGSRLYPGKDYFLVLDYAENVRRHCPDGNVYAPIVTTKVKGESKPIKVICEFCLNENFFSPRINKDGFKIDKNGYFLDMRGHRIALYMGEKFIGYMPAHYGRRCCFHVGTERCDYRWVSKECTNLKCGKENDIAARYCEFCKTELVNPNDKLNIFESKELKPLEVLRIQEKNIISKKGNPTLLVNYITDRGIIPVWYHPTNIYNSWRHTQYLEAKARGIRRVKISKSKTGYYNVDTYFAMMRDI